MKKHCHVYVAPPSLLNKYYPFIPFTSRTMFNFYAACTIPGGQEVVVPSLSLMGPGGQGHGQRAVRGRYQHPQLG